MSSVISFKLQRSLFKNSPLAEKTRSVSTDVGGTNESADQICFTLSVSSRFDMKRLISLASVSVLGLVGSVSLFSRSCNSLASGAVNSSFRSDGLGWSSWFTCRLTRRSGLVSSLSYNRWSKDLEFLFNVCCHCL